jgi:uncharacterized protein (DUF697 family)
VRRLTKRSEAIEQKHMAWSWHSWTKQILAPKADEARLDRELEKAKGRVAAPVLWLLGKTQSGKSSIIKGLTGRSDIEIGEGWQACTRTSRLYAFPDEHESLIRFLDTRGIGEPHYDPTEDLAYAERHAHGILVVMRACDPAQESIKAVLATVRGRRPTWPVILVQTTLHEGYPRGASHPEPYCFGNSPFPEAVPADLARAIDYQRCDFQGLVDRHVAIDFTHPEDGYEPRLYGLDALWDVLADVVPDGLRGVLAAKPECLSGIRDVLFETAVPHVVSYSILAGAAAMVPAPLANLTGVTAAQAKMMHSIASIYGRPLTHGLVALGPAVGVSFLPRMVARSFLAGVPVLGSAAAGVWTAATTYALGCALCWYYAEVARGAEPNTAAISRVYHEELLRGHERFQTYFASLATRGGRPSSPTETKPDAA